MHVHVRGEQKALDLDCEGGNLINVWPQGPETTLRRRMAVLACPSHVLLLYSQPTTPDKQGRPRSHPVAKVIRLQGRGAGTPAAHSNTIPFLDGPTHASVGMWYALSNDTWAQDAMGRPTIALSVAVKFTDKTPTVRRQMVITCGKDTFNFTSDKSSPNGMLQRLTAARTGSHTLPALLHVRNAEVTSVNAIRAHQPRTAFKQKVTDEFKLEREHPQRQRARQLKVKVISPINVRPADIRPPRLPPQPHPAVPIGHGPHVHAAGAAAKLAAALKLVASASTGCGSGYGTPPPGAPPRCTGGAQAPHRPTDPLPADLLKIVADPAADPTSAEVWRQAIDPAMTALQALAPLQSYNVPHHCKRTADYLRMRKAVVASLEDSKLFLKLSIEGAKLESFVVAMMKTDAICRRSHKEKLDLYKTQGATEQARIHLTTSAKDDAAQIFRNKIEIERATKRLHALAAEISDLRKRIFLDATGTEESTRPLFFKWLGWHGTGNSKDGVSTDFVAQHGLDPDKSSDRCLLGKAVYLAENPAYSASFAHKGEMMVASVLMEAPNIAVGMQHFRRGATGPVARTDGTVGVDYTPTNGPAGPDNDPRCSNVFAVWRPELLVPLFKVTYGAKGHGGTHP